MAKELPFFKFEPNAWDNGNIQMLSREEKGLFIDICSMYWSRLGDLPKKLVVQKLCAGNATALNSLCEEQIIEIIEGNIYIKFLTIQLQEFENTSSQNSENAKKRWQKHREQKDSSERNASASNPHCETNAIREEKRREEEIRKENINKPDSELFSGKLLEAGAEERKKVPPKKERPEPPDLDTFIQYAKETYQNDLKQDFSPFAFAVQSKYESWMSAGWKDGNGKSISNWKTKLKNTIPHLKAIYKNGSHPGYTNNTKTGTGKISGHQFIAGKLRELSARDSESGDNTIDIEAFEVK